MEYQVPQFIEIEDRIVGPLTLRQFIYLAGGAGLCALAFFYLPIIFAGIIALPIAGLTVALSFYKVNGKPFVEVMESAFGYYTSNKLFLWKHEDKPVKTATPQTPAASRPGTTTPRLTRDKLTELAWSLDVKNKQ